MNIITAGALDYLYYHVRQTVTQTSREFNYIFTSLTLNTSYRLFMKGDGEYQWCSNFKLMGLYSTTIIISTGDTSEQS